MNTKTSITYTKYLHLLNASNEMLPFPFLDSVEERLLNYIASIWYVGKKLTVLEAINALEDISQSTAHKRLKALRKKDFIDLEVDRNDNRIKYIVHTELTDKYFSHLGQCLTNAVLN